jgi:hypothetical protein
MKTRKHAGLPVVLGAISALVMLPPAGAVDCNTNGTDDLTDLIAGTSLDCNLDGVPDECPLPDVVRLFGGLVSFGITANSIADMDGDGDMDIVAAFADYTTSAGRRGDHDAIVVLLNRGDGEIAHEERHVLGVPLRNHYEADIDSDGDVDSVALLEEDHYRDSPLSLRVLFNRGDGVLIAGSDVPVPGRLVTSPSLTDVDGDGDLDFVSTDFGVYYLSGHGDDIIGKDLVVVYNQGGGNFGAARRFPAGDSPDQHVMADLDGDGDLDAVLSNTGDVREGEGPTVDTVSVLRNRGDGTFEAPVPHALGYAATLLKAADLDGDGDTDVIATSWFESRYSILHGDGHGGFSTITHHPLTEGTGPDQLHVDDLDQDGDLDFVTSRWTYGDINDIAMYINHGSGNFEENQVFVYPEKEHPIDSMIGDLDGDGDLDVAAALYQNNRVVLHLNDGSGLFLEPSYVDVGDPSVTEGNPQTIFAADMNSDGVVDLVAGRSIVFGGGAQSPGAGENAGCREFLRGDFNVDGQVSLSDVIAIRRWLFSGKGTPSCKDAGDATDNESLSITDMVAILRPALMTPDWPDLLPAPLTSPGPDPSYAGDDPEARPMGCRAYDVAPPAQGNASITFGAAVAGPGEEVEIPVLLTSDAPVEGFQLVMEYDPARLGVVDGASGLSFEGTFYEARFAAPPTLGALTVHTEAGVFTVAVIGNFIEDGFEVPPGTDIPVARIRAIVPETAEVGTVVSIEPAPGSEAGGVGPFRLRNEITVESDARFVSAFSSVGVARINIVGDQAFFRGDSNGDSTVNMTDAISLLGALFLGGERPACSDAADSNDDGKLDIADALAILNFLFTGTSVLPAPHPDRGSDPTPDALHCHGPAA